MLIGKNGHGELVAKSETRAAEFGSSLALASMGVFHGLVAVKGRHVFVVGGRGLPAGGGGGGGAGGGGSGAGGSIAGGSSQTTPFTLKGVGRPLVPVMVPSTTMFVASFGGTVVFQ